jgi:hypothetical protein
MQEHGREPKSRHTTLHVALSYWIMAENPTISAETDHGGEPKIRHRYLPWHRYGRYLTTLITVKSMVSIPEPVRY